MGIKVREIRVLAVEMTDENGDTDELIRFSPGNWYIKIDGSYDPMSAREHMEAALNAELESREWVDTRGPK